MGGQIIIKEVNTYFTCGQIYSIWGKIKQVKEDRE